MPVDMFPAINIPVVVVATFYSGMPPEQVENSITFRLERFLTLGSGIEHIESRSLTGVSIIKVFFHPGTNPDAAVAMIGGLATAEMSRLPPGTLPPVVLKFDASSLPVCLLTLGGEGLSETQLKDIAQNVIRNQLAGVPGASVPQPFGGRGRQMMLYADPFKLEAHQLSLMDVVRTIGESNVILPAGDVQIGRLDYNIYTNSMLGGVSRHQPGSAEDGRAISRQGLRYRRSQGCADPAVQHRAGQRPAVRLSADPEAGRRFEHHRSRRRHSKQGHESWRTSPMRCEPHVVFDQSEFVKSAIETLLHEGALGLFLTSLMILVFLGSMRATVAVFFSIPLSALATFMALQIGGSSINTMVLGGLALALSRLIDNSVVVLENIYRHLEMGEPPAVAAEQGGREVALPVLAATLTTVVVFFPVTLLYGVSKYLFSSLALAVVLSLFASYAVAMTVVPLFCARFMKQPPAHAGNASEAVHWRALQRLVQSRVRALPRLSTTGSWRAPLPVRSLTLGAFACVFFASSADRSPARAGLLPDDRCRPVRHSSQGAVRHTAGGDRERYQKARSADPRIVPEEELAMIVSNIGVDPGLLRDLHQQLRDAHRLRAGGAHRGSPRRQLRIHRAREAGDAGGTAPAHSVFRIRQSRRIHVEHGARRRRSTFRSPGSNLQRQLQTRLSISREKSAKIRGVADVFIPQDLDQPALEA